MDKVTLNICLHRFLITLSSIAELTLVRKRIMDREMRIKSFPVGRLNSQVSNVHIL